MPSLELVAEEVQETIGSAKIVAPTVDDINPALPY